MRVLKIIAGFVIVILAGGIVLQAIGYIDSPVFNWFTEIHLFN